MSLPGLTAESFEFKTGDTLEVDFTTGQIVLGGARALQAEPFSQVQLDIYQAGDIFAYGKSFRE